MPVALVFAGLALGGYHLAYGLRPVGARTEETPHPDGRLREVLEKAESQILAIELAAANLGQVELQARLRGIADQARNIIELILQRPDDLYRARRFLSVYLEGAERVASRYARTHRVNHAHPLEDSFRRVLVEIERVFQDQHERLARNDLGDLDVQISVLRKQLEQEGL